MCFSGKGTLREFNGQVGYRSFSLSRGNVLQSPYYENVTLWREPIVIDEVGQAPALDNYRGLHAYRSLRTAVKERRLGSSVFAKVLLFGQGVTHKRGPAGFVNKEAGHRAEVMVIEELYVAEYSTHLTGRLKKLYPTVPVSAVDLDGKKAR